MNFKAFLITITLASTPTVFAENCLQSYEQLKTDAQIFAGYAQAANPDTAVELAKVNLIQNIFNRISVSQRLQDHLIQLAKEGDIFLLNNLRISKRCTPSDNSHEVLVTLHRESLVRNIRNYLESLVAKSQSTLKQLQDSSNPEQKAAALAKAQELYDQYAADFDEILYLCKAYNSCATINKSAFYDLKESLKSENYRVVKPVPASPKKTFTPKPMTVKPVNQEVPVYTGWKVKFLDSTARDCRVQILNLLSAKGIKIQENSPRVINVRCSVNEFGKPAGMDYQITEIICRASSNAFTYTFNGKGTATNARDAYVMARSRLE